MTNKENAQELILNYIREKQGLDSMSNGFTFKHNGHLWTVCGVSGDEGEFSDFIAVYQPYADRLPSTRLWSKVELEQLSNIEIIGHEVQWIHLLWAMNSSKSKYLLSTLGICEYDSLVIELDTCNSVEWNINNNEELQTYLINLFGL